MRLEQHIADLFSMTDETWARHANPWSVWTRFTAFPARILAAWSRAWLGRWSAVPLAAALAWTWLNPRLFDRPATARSWASRAVLGERVWMNRDEVPIPPAYRTTPVILNGLSALAFLVTIWGLVRLSSWPTFVGAAVALVLKTVFLGQMVSLYDEMRDSTTEYRSWSY
jgi:hypothetical protein